jgi:hypothetical protein
MDPERKRRQDEAYKLQIWGMPNDALLNLEDPAEATSKVSQGL